MRIFYPSYEFERRTKAFNRYIAFPVSLVCMFSITIVVLAAFYACTVSILGIVSAFIWDYFMWFLILPVLIFVATAYQGVTWCKALLTSYRFEEKRIVRGIIGDASGVRDINFAIGSVAAGIAVNNITDGSRIATANTVRNANIVFNRIKANTNKKFVDTFFDTEAYAKKVFENPVFVKETKYTLVYRCDNKKKLVIPKIYEGMCSAPEKKGASYISRILGRSFIITAVAFLLCVVDLAIGYSKNDVYIEQIGNSQDELFESFEAFDYEMHQVNETMVEFEKDLGDKTSSVKYYLDKKGNIKGVEATVYYDKNSQNVEEELGYIISTYDTTFATEDVDNFIGLAIQAIEGDYEYGKLISDDYTLYLGTSGEYIDIHNY